jgi:hypothetical protein
VISMSEEDEGTKQIFKCDEPGCSFETESPKGLAGHKRLAHRRPTITDGLRGYADKTMEVALDKLDHAWDEQFKRLKAATQAREEAHDTLIKGILSVFLQMHPEISLDEDEKRALRTLGIPLSSEIMERVKRE